MPYEVTAESLRKFTDNLKSEIVATVKEQVGNFLEEHADAKIFVEERAKRLAELAAAYATAADEIAKKAVLYDMAIVRQSLQNEVTSVALDASKVARATFSKVLSAVTGAVVKLAPILLRAL